MTKTKLYQLLPVRDFPLAVLVATLAMIFLWAAGYPYEEWPAIVAVFYVAFRFGLAGAMGLLAYAAKFVAGYGKRVLNRHGVEVSGGVPAGSGPRRARAWLATAIVSVVGAIAVGCGVFAAILAVGWLEITPLPPVFLLAAWGLWVYGGIGLGLMLLAPAALFWMVDARIRVSSAGLSFVFSLIPEIQDGIPSARHR